MRTRSLVLLALLGATAGHAAAQVSPDTARPAVVVRTDTLGRTVVVRSDPRGLRLGARLNLSSIELTDQEDAGAERGIGAGVVLGYGFTRRLGVFLSADYASVDYQELASGEEYALVHVDLGARYAVGTGGSPLRPYVEVAGTYIIESDDLDGSEYSLTGAGVTAGLGAEFFLSHDASIDVGVRGTLGKLTDGEFDGEEIDPNDRLRSFRLLLGVSWRPWRPRGEAP